MPSKPQPKRIEETKLPTLAISIRQPWAWLIVNGFKDVENRDWPTNYRGPILIHASTNRSGYEWNEAIKFLILTDRFPDEVLSQIVKRMPSFDDMQRGGIVGVADIVNCTPESESPWFVGEFGFVLQNARPLPFVSCRGALKIFTPDVSAAKLTPGQK